MDPDLAATLARLQRAQEEHTTLLKDISAQQAALGTALAAQSGAESNEMASALVGALGTIVTAQAGHGGVLLELMGDLRALLRAAGVASTAIAATAPPTERKTPAAPPPERKTPRYTPSKPVSRTPSTSPHEPSTSSSPPARAPAAPPTPAGTAPTPTPAQRKATAQHTAQLMLAAIADIENSCPAPSPVVRPRHASTPGLGMTPLKRAPSPSPKPAPAPSSPPNAAPPNTTPPKSAPTPPLTMDQLKAAQREMARRQREAGAKAARTSTQGSAPAASAWPLSKLKPTSKPVVETPAPKPKSKSKPTTAATPAAARYCTQWNTSQNACRAFSCPLRHECLLCGPAGRVATHRAFVGCPYRKK